METEQKTIYQDTKFLYTSDQFNTLHTSTLVTSIIALVSSVAVLSSFLYLWIMDRKRANRISLRCVMIACTANGLDSIMNITMSFVQGPHKFCRAAGVISNISRLTSASFLAIVGLNLVLIFVINVKRRDLLEYFYYPCACLYILICAAVSIYKIATLPYLDSTNDTCWFLNYIDERSQAVFSWMWYYGFLFFINIVAGISSGIALYKLIHEQQALRKNVDHNTYMGEASTNQAESRFQRRQSAVLSKVVVRCIIYPLIPLVVNIWGFGIQMKITIIHKPPSFTLAMFDTIFACLDGFLVAIVFFTDPALTAFVNDRIQYWRRVYVEEYRLVEIRNDTSDTMERKKEKTQTLYIMPPLDIPHADLTNWDSAIIHTNPTSRYSSTSHNRVPMRRICIPPSSLTQLSSRYNIRQLSLCTLPSSSDTLETVDNGDQPVSHFPMQQIPSTSSVTNLTSDSQPTESQRNVIHEVFIPYKSIWWARLCHRLFSQYGFSLFSPSSSRSGPRSSSTIELRSYSQQQRETVYQETTDDDHDSTKYQRKQFMDDQTCHY
ncbi:uncharacterized protein BX664DRAFT_369152 [Halteromyces radiatus]|uniref:uncharacterized protein n=1 Tax=Halteromyces radiatus TaxID=101107 RepID=UPI0022201A52|nr:uncharacterized protein BX664DRAFT_369152 [Halteromyces radiatus]KAI8078695.1 hypothetical protein BX664DRAFT_369152 [Halteromyces radiatus]